MSMSGAVSLDVIAIHKTLDCYDIPYDEDRLDLINRIQQLESISLNLQHEETRRNSKKKK